MKNSLQNSENPSTTLTYRLKTYLATWKLESGREELRKTLQGEATAETSVTLARLRRVSFVILASFPMFKKWQFFIKLAMQHAYFLRYLTYFWLPKFKIVLNLLISIVASFYGCEFFVCVVDNIILQCSRFIKLLLPVSFIFSFIFLLTSVWVTYFINLCEVVLLMIYSLSFFLRISLSFLNFKE